MRVTRRPRAASIALCLLVASLLGAAPAYGERSADVVRYLDAGVPDGGHVGFTYETYVAEGLAYGAVQSALFAAAGGAATADDIYDEANGGEGGGAAPACDVHAQKPRGYANWETWTVHVEVTADVWCNFSSPRIDVKVLLRGYDVTGSVGHYSPDVTCYGWSCTVTAHYSHYMSCSDGWEWMYYGMPYGSFKLKNGSTRTLRGSGEAGPSIAGRGWRWCDAAA